MHGKKYYYESVYRNHILLFFQSDGGAPHSPGPPLSPRRSQEDLPFCNHGGIRRLQRTLSEDVRQRRRESLTLPSSPSSVPANLVSAGSSIGQSK